jgi:outer membrane protein TolC
MAPAMGGAQVIVDAPAIADTPAVAPVSSGSRPSAPSSDVEPFRSSAPPLTLGECIRRALARGFDMELQGHDVAIAREDLPIAQSLFDPVISAGTARSTDQTGHRAATPDLYSTGVGSQIGITQRLKTGTTVTLGSRLDRFASNQPRTIINGSTLETTANSLSYTSGLTLDISQPLLKGFGGVNRIPIRQAEISADIAKRSYEDRALDVVQRTEAAYYLLTGARDQLSVFNTSQQLAERLLREADARHTAGMATKLDILEAQVGIANAKLNVLQAENAVRASEDQLLAMIGRFELDTPIGATRVDDVSSDVSPTVDASYALALEHQPALRNARLGLQLSRLQLELAQDDLKPSVDLDLTLGLTGDDQRRSRAFSNAFEPERSAWQAGFTITYPLGRAGEKARFRQATHAVSRDELLVHQLEQDVLVAIRAAVRTVQTSQESVRLAALASNLAKEQYDAERIRYRSGLSTSRRVLEVQKDLEAARVAQLQAKLDLRTALSALYRIEGSSLDHYGITLRSDFH